MPTENINIETQVQSAITRSALLALIAANTVKKKIYHITDALSATATIAVFSRSTNQVSYNAMNLNTGKFGMYFITFDVFNPIIEGSDAVQSYVDNTYFPPTGNYNTVYLDLSTGDAYAWNGTTYFALSGGNVYEPTVGDFPLTGDADTLYIATDTGVMYLWDGSAYVALNSIPYIPLAGTVSGSPATGPIETTASIGMRKLNNEMVIGSGNNETLDGSRYAKTIYRTTSAGISRVENVLKSASYEAHVNIYAGSPTDRPQILVGSDNPTFAGVIYDSNYRSNFGDFSLIDLLTLKEKFWTKAGTPTTSDDSTQGYIVGSLIWDTTNSILYRCTDNTATAAVWVNAIQGITTFKSTTDSAAVTGTTTVTKLRSQLIPANTFNVGEVIRIRWRDRKTGTAGNATHSLYVNTSDTITGASLLGFFTQTSTRVSFQGKRDLVIKSSTVTEVADNGTSLVADDADIQTAFDNINVNWAVDQYIIFAVNPANAGDSMVNSSYIIEKL